MENTNEEYLKQLYGKNLESQKATLEQAYNQSNESLDYRKEQAQKNADRNVNLTKVENQQAAVNNAEYYAAAGLSSGAKAQARLAQDNQLQADIAAIRAAQQAADADVERQRSLLAKEYALEIQKAQAANDMELAQALYQDAKEEDKKLLAKQEAAARLMASTGDFSGYGALYGLTPEQIAALSTRFQEEENEADAQKQRADQEAAAKLMAAAGDFSLYGSLYGLTPEQIAALNSAYKKKTETAAQTGTDTGTTGGNTWNNGELNEDMIKQLQTFFGVEADGKWGKKSSEAAGGLTADEAWEAFASITPDTIADEVALFKSQGVDRKEILAYLSKAIDAGIITSGVAAKILNNTYKK